MTLPLQAEPPAAHDGTAHPSPAAGDRPIAHMVGYAHLDPVWLWPWTEGYAEARATLRSAIERMREYPEFVFTFTSVVFLDWVRESDPDLFAEIALRVAEGRFHLAGGWWVEGDCNLPSGEALVRQGLYGQRFLAEHFGVIATVAGNPDSFGHPATLPQLVAGCGMPGYFFQRPEPNELALPGQTFTWRGPDGTEIPAYRIPRYTSEGHELAGHVRDCLRLATAAEPELMLFYGVGNHGGGPTRRNLDSLRRIHATSATLDLVCSTPRAYLEAATRRAERLPVHDGELQHHARGCYAAHAGIKALNRRAEGALLTAEAWATVAHATCGLPYPAAELRRAWRQVLFNQFHDTLAGTAIESAYDDARNQLGEALAIAQRTTNAALGRLGQRARIAEEPDMQPILVFNPHPWPLRCVVECDVGGWAKRMNLVDEAGRPVALQWGDAEATIAEGRYRAVFAADLPASGYRLYRLRLGPNGYAVPPEPPAGTLENDRVRARIDAVTGRLIRLLDKTSGVDVMAGATGPHAVVLVDDADTWGHGRDRWDNEAGVFTVAAIERVEHGPARSVVRVTSRYRASTLVEDYRLGRDDAYIDVAVTLDWREQRRMLKLRYPTALHEGSSAVSVTAEVPYGVVIRAASGTEEVMQRWLDVTGTVGALPAGLAIANDGKYAYDVGARWSGADIGITVARSVPHAHHEPAVLASDRAYRWLDIGEQRFTLRLIPHGGDWRAAGVDRRAVELNQRPTYVRDTYHDGVSAALESFAVLEGDHAAGVVLKRAEDGGATIVRVAETHGRGGPVTLRLGFRGREVSAELGPHQVATFRVPDDPDERVARVDLCEWSDADRPVGQPTPDGRPRLPGGGP